MKDRLTWCIILSFRSHSLPVFLNGFLLSLAKESLDGAGISFEMSMTCKFLKVNKGESSKFFETHVTNMEELAKIINELIAFLGDFEESLHDIFKKGRVRLEQIKKEKSVK